MAIAAGRKRSDPRSLGPSPDFVGRLLALALDAGNMVQNGTNSSKCRRCLLHFPPPGCITTAPAPWPRPESGRHGGCRQHREQLHISEDGGSTGNWSTCIHPTGFALRPDGAGTIENSWLLPLDLRRSMSGRLPDAEHRRPGQDRSACPIPASSIIASLYGPQCGTVRYGRLLHHWPAIHAPYQLQRGDDLGQRTR